MTSISAPYPTADINSGDRLGFTIFIAIAIHAMIIFGISFTAEDRNTSETLPSIDIILANSYSIEEPDEYDFLAQTNQTGGGINDEKARPGAPVSANTPFNQQGLADQAQQERLKNQLQLKEIYFITQREDQRQLQSTKQNKTQDNSQLQTDTIEQRRKTIASLQAEIRKMALTFAKRPKVLTLTASSKKSIEAGYLAAWVSRIEHIGNLNYPQQARTQKISGQLRVNVKIDALGKVLDINISKSSGNTLLDESARRIVKLAQPYDPLPSEMRDYADQIIIIRTWKFSSQGLTTDE